MTRRDYILGDSSLSAYEGWKTSSRTGQTSPTVPRTTQEPYSGGGAGTCFACSGRVGGLVAVAHDILAGMSGRSRSRRGRGGTAPKRRSTVRGGRARGGGRQALRLPSLREVYDAVIAGCADLESATDALDAELWLAANVCAIRAEAPDEQAYHLAMLDLVDER